MRTTLHIGSLAATGLAFLLVVALVVKLAAVAVVFGLFAAAWYGLRALWRRR